MTKRWCVCLLAAFCCFLWGSAFPCIKIGYQVFQIGAGDTASQILFAGLRFTLSGVLVVSIGSLLNRHWLHPKKGSGGMILWLAFFQTVLQYLFFYVGMAHTTGVKGSIIEAANVFLAVLFASLLFRQERFTLAKAVGCALGFAGVVLINLSGGSLGGGFSLLGEGFVLLSAASYAMSSVLVKRYSARENPVVLSGYQFLCGGVVMILVGLLWGGRLRPVTATAFLLLLYLAMLSAVAYSVWSLLLRHNDVSQVTVYGFATPLFGVILSAVLLDEGNPVPWLQSIAALLLTCVSIYIVNRPERTVHGMDKT